jgi:hypothetical protein
MHCSQVQLLGGQGGYIIFKEAPLPVPPKPGILPAQAFPLHSGQTLQKGLSLSLACSLNVLRSISPPPSHLSNRYIY